MKAAGLSFPLIVSLGSAQGLCMALSTTSLGLFPSSYSQPTWCQCFLRRMRDRGAVTVPQPVVGQQERSGCGLEGGWEGLVAENLAGQGEKLRCLHIAL